MIRIKICGTTSVHDAEIAVRAGADAVGLIFYQESPRKVDPQTAREICHALPPLVSSVGVFVNTPPEMIERLRQEVGFDYVQLHGDEPPEMIEELGPRRVIKALRLKSEMDLPLLDRYGAAGALLLDTPREGFYGGTGLKGDWPLARAAVRRCAELGQPVLLAGGLTPDNVGEAVRTVEPFGLDVVSGVERKPGEKDANKVQLFVRKAVAAGLGS